MKLILTIILIIIPYSAIAQNDDMQGADMQKMMQGMQKMQECMANVDQAELQNMESEAEEFSAEIQALCDQGKRSKAQKKAIKYSKKIMKNPAMKQMQKCGEMANEFIPAHLQESTVEEEFDFSNKHVCDEE